MGRMIPHGRSPRRYWGVPSGGLLALLVLVATAVQVAADKKKPPHQPPPRFGHARFHDLNVPAPVPAQPITVALEHATACAPPTPFAAVELNDLGIDPPAPSAELAPATVLGYDDMAGGPAGKLALRVRIQNLKRVNGAFVPWQFDACVPPQDPSNLLEGPSHIYDATFILSRATAPNLFQVEYWVHYEYVVRDDQGAIVSRESRVLHATETTP